MIDRRSLLAAGVATGIAASTDSLAAVTARRFPNGFLWGAATAGHQVEGNNINADCWLLENVKPTIFAEPSRDAANSFNLWGNDLDLVRRMGLNTYRFSLEWARIEPEEGLFSVAMLDHYKAMIEACRARGITPMVTFNHFTTPRWFAALGGWGNARSVALFARYCDTAARHLAAHIGYATTLNEPNLAGKLQNLLPPQFLAGDKAMGQAAARAMGVAQFAAGNALYVADLNTVQKNLIAGHKAGRAAIKAVRPDLPVGVSLAMFDDQAVGPNSLRDTKRAYFYGDWLNAVRGDDFLGVQNYERNRWTDTGKLDPPADARRNTIGAEVYAPSLAGVVRYAHAATGVPIIVTEHGVGSDDDTLRAWLIPEALKHLHAAMAEGVPVKGYVHWSLIDNFEWVFGYRIHFGLHSLNRQTFARTAKPSAKIYGAIARANAI